MSLFVCVDCGGTKISVAIADASGEIVGRAISGPGNFVNMGVQSFAAALRHTVASALESTGLPEKKLPTPTTTENKDNEELLNAPSGAGSSTPFAAAWLGVAGMDSPAAMNALAPHASAALGIPLGANLTIANDTHVLAAPALLDAHPDASAAVVVIAGTGSNSVSFRRAASGAPRVEELARSGGWGWMLGDEGGAYGVGREAMRELLREHDEAHVIGHPATRRGNKGTLESKVLEFLRVDDVMEALIPLYYPDPIPSKDGGRDDPVRPACHLQSRTQRLSGLCPLVFASAFEDGDPRALDVLRKSAGWLASRVSVLLRNADGDAGRAVRAAESVICFGGSLVGVSAYRQMILDELEAQGHVFRHVMFVDDPAGAGARCLASVYGK